MKPTSASSHRVDRRHFLAALGMAGLAGCASPLMRGQSPEEEITEQTAEKKAETVGDFTRTYGLNWIKLESIALVTNLDNTGSDPPPSSQRIALIGEMQSHGVQKADNILSSPTTSMVICRTYLPPAVQKGDRVDVEVRTPSRSETTSLRGGWLMASRMRRMEVLGGQIRMGNVEGLAQGDVVVDAIFEGTTDPIKEKRARVLGGGISNIARNLGLVISNEEKSVRISMLIGSAINSRFHRFDAGVKQGVAEPTRDNFIELHVSPRYKHNLGRYLRVIRHIVLKESAVEKTERLQLLAKKLLEPASAPVAALQLEAIGKPGIDALKKGLASREPEVRFYAAEALAYMDEADAAKPLMEAARDTSAFRWHALTALTAMDHVAAYDVLSELLHVSSVETRYGAFRAIRTRNPQDPVTKGEALDQKFAYHLIPTTGEPLVHVTRSKRAEIVLFGNDMRVKPPEFLSAGKYITIKGLDDGQLRVSRFAPNQPDASETCQATLDQLIRTVVKLGAKYGNIVEMLQEARKTGCLEARLAIEAIARPGRAFIRDAEEAGDQPPVESEENGETSELESLAPLAERKAATPTPELFTDKLQNSADDEKPRAEIMETYVDPAYREKKKKSVLDRINPWSEDKGSGTGG